MDGWTHILGSKENAVIMELKQITLYLALSQIVLLCIQTLRPLVCILHTRPQYKYIDHFIWDAGIPKE